MTDCQEHCDGACNRTVTALKVEKAKAGMYCDGGGSIAVQRGEELGVVMSIAGAGWGRYCGIEEGGGWMGRR